MNDGSYRPEQVRANGAQKPAVVPPNPFPKLGINLSLLKQTKAKLLAEKKQQATNAAVAAAEAQAQMAPADQQLSSPLPKISTMFQQPASAAAVKNGVVDHNVVGPAPEPSRSSAATALTAEEEVRFEAGSLLKQTEAMGKREILCDKSDRVFLRRKTRPTVGEV